MGGGSAAILAAARESCHSGSAGANPHRGRQGAGRSEHPRRSLTATIRISPSPQSRAPRSPGRVDADGRFGVAFALGFLVGKRWWENEAGLRSSHPAMLWGRAHGQATPALVDPWAATGVMLRAWWNGFVHTSVYRTQPGDIQAPLG